MTKNYKLTLGVIALSTIIILAGASFAYFVTNIGGSGNTSNNTSTVTAVSLGEIKYDGELTFNGDNIYPGYKNIQTFTIGPDVSQGTGIYEIDLEANVPSEFKNDIEITLYKTTSPTTNNITRTEGSLTLEENQFYKEDAITINGTPEKVYEGTLTNNNRIVLEQSDFEVPGIKNTTYYLVYNYKNNGEQNTQQGKSFTGKVTVRYIVEKMSFSDALLACNDTAANCLLNNSSLDTTNLAYDNTVDNNLRYIGANPNNYVRFNNELWRIIGVMNNIDDGNGNKASRLKIIRNESIGSYSWDGSDSTINSGYGVNEWSQADLNTLLNDYYYNAKSNQTCYNGHNNRTISCDFSSNGLKDATSKNMIDTVIWNTGTKETKNFNSASNGLSSHYYTYERSNDNGKICTSGSYCNDTVTRTTTWKGKIGLMYPSDYGYATSGGTTTNRETCLNKELYNWNDISYSDCKNNDWLYNSSTWQWTLMPHARSTYASHVFYVDARGYVIYNTAGLANGVAPTLYLTANTRIESGMGTENAPFTLTVG